MTDRLQDLYNNARRQTFEHNGAKITVRESLGIDKMDMSVYRRFIRDCLLEEANTNKPDKQSEITGIGDVAWNRIINFVVFAVRTIKIKGINFQVPTSFDDENVWHEAYWKFLCLPGDLIEVWDDALVEINKTEPDPEAEPDDEKSTTTT